MAHVTRQQLGRRRQAFRSLGPIRLQCRPILLGEHLRRGFGDVAQQIRIVDAGEAGDACSGGEPSEAQVRNRQPRRVVRREQRGRRRIALGVASAPVVYDAHRVRVRLRINPVDYQYPPVVLLEKLRVAGKRGVGNIAGLADLVALGPVVDDGLAGGIGLGITEARGVPAPIGLDEHEEFAAVVGGVDQR